jgi:hypothetical protein
MSTRHELPGFLTDLWRSLPQGMRQTRDIQSS